MILRVFAIEKRRDRRMYLRQVLKAVKYLLEEEEEPSASESSIDESNGPAEFGSSDDGHDFEAVEAADRVEERMYELFD